MIKFHEYQEFVNGMKRYPWKHAIIYPTIKLNGEAGEVAEKVGKVLRDEAGVFSDEKKEEIVKELGDVLWYICSLADDLGYSLEDVVNNNVRKLTSRKERGVMSGSGDNR
jgi:NTP pyrophosphatase (non-canonical NTP hydrolase)